MAARSRAGASRMTTTVDGPKDAVQPHRRVMLHLHLGQRSVDARRVGLVALLVTSAWEAQPPIGAVCHGNLNGIVTRRDVPLPATLEICTFPPRASTRGS
jgi:hypothetical protein